MKKISILLALAILIGCVSVFEAAAEDELRYGRSKLAEMERAEDYVGAYDAIYEAIASKDAFAFVDDFHLSTEEFDMVYQCYLNDAGEHYYIDNTYELNTHGDEVSDIGIHYLGGTHDHEKYEKAIDEFVALTANAESDYEKSLILHDALVQSITYMEVAQAHNSYGALVNGYAVCEGYAEAYQVLLREVGIMSYVVRGTGITSKGEERHAWNLVRLDGKFYYSDLTWDDESVSGMSESEKPVFYAYFNVPEDYFFNHVPDDPYGLLPECHNVDMMYEDLTIVKEYTVDNVAGAFKTVCGHSVARINYVGEREDYFFEWLSANLQELATKVGAFGRISYILCGTEHYIEISEPMPEHVYDNSCDTDCNICGYKRFVSHRFGLIWCSSGGKHWHECTVCGTHADEAPHIDSDGICRACGEAIVIGVGDVDLEEGVTANDAIYLLYNIFFGEASYPVNQSCDFDGSGNVDANDAIYLLYHVFFGEASYPLY